MGGQEGARWAVGPRRSEDKVESGDTSGSAGGKGCDVNLNSEHSHAENREPRHALSDLLTQSLVRVVLELVHSMQRVRAISPAQGPRSSSVCLLHEKKLRRAAGRGTQ